MKSPLLFCLTCISVAALTVGAQAASLDSFDFYGSGGSGADPDTVAPTLATGVTGSNLFRGSGLGGPISYLPNAFTFVGADQSTLTAAETNNRYVTFSIAPTSGMLSLTDLSFSAFSRNHGSTIALTDSQGNLLDSVYTGDSTDSYAPTSLDLSFGTLPDVISGTTSFRLYVYGNTSYYNELGFGNSSSDIGSDFSVNGTAIPAVSPSVPEPGTYPLLGLGFVGLAAGLRRRLARA